MRYLIAVLVLLSGSAWGGPIAEQFSGGYNGVRWGLPLSDLVGMLPQGEHHFSTAPGERVYIVTSDQPILGVPRPGATTQYHFGKNGGVEYIALSVPYERRDELLGALVSQFGAYARKSEIGATVHYDWRRDRNVGILVRVSKDPRYGIAELWITHYGDTPTKP
jgi:hypothetical protein